MNHHIWIPFIAGMTFACQVSAQSAGIVTPDTSSSVDSHTSRATLDLSSEKKIASAQLRFGDDDKFFLLNVSGPFDEEEGEALLGNLDRLANSTNVELGYQHGWWKGGDNPGYTLRLGGRFGRPTFKYLDLASNTLTTTQKDSQELSIGASMFVPKSRGILLALTYKNVSAFEGAPVRNICTPISGTTASECRNVGTAAPELAKTDIAVAQASFLATANVGMRISVAYDFEKDVTGVEVPIYLVRTEKTGLLTGGIKLSWQSEDHETQYMIFLSQPLGDW